jgi:hypothetical protein
MLSGMAASSMDKVVIQLDVQLAGWHQAGKGGNQLNVQLEGRHLAGRMLASNWMSSSIQQG